MDKFIITTTPTIEGHPIKAYLGAINVNVVIGTNFFSDFAASFTDVFGGVHTESAQPIVSNCSC